MALFPLDKPGFFVFQNP